MAIDLDKVVGTDPNNPIRRIRSTGTSSQDEIDRDSLGFLHAIDRAAGITPSGTPDNAVTSQRLQALKQLFGARVATYAAARALDSSTLTDGQLVWKDGFAYPWRVKTGTVTDNGWYLVFTDDSNRYLESTSPTINADIFDGVVGDGTTDDWAGLNKAVTHFNSVTTTQQAVFQFTSKKYRITQPLDFSQTGGERRQVIGGAGFETVEIIVDFDGYGTGAVGEGAFILGDEDSPAYQTAIDLGGFQFTKGPNCTRCPVGVIGILAQSRINNITFGSWNNSLYRCVSWQNTRAQNLTSFSGGKAWEYKDASAITVQQSGTTLTASGAIFDANDVGHTVSIWGTGGSTVRRKAVIVSYTSTTVVEVDVTFTDGAARELYFGCPLVSMTASSAILTADASCFTADDVGLVVWVKGAGASGRILRSKIASYTSATQVTLADNASTTVSDVEFTTPAVDIYSGGAGDASDNTFINLQVENHVGVGVCAQNQDQLKLITTKIHGEQSATSDRYSIAPIWIDQCEGYYQGSFDAQYLGEEKIYGVYQSACFNFDVLTLRSAYDEKILTVGARASGFEGGIIQLNQLSISGANSSNTDLESLIADANSSPAGHVLTGKVSFNEYDASVSYGVRNPGQTDLTFSGGITWNGTAPTGGSERYRYYRVGNLVFFDFRLDYSSSGTTNSSVTIAIPSDMPQPKLLADTGGGEILQMLRGAMSVDNTGASAPALSKCYLRGDGGGGYEVILGLNSSSISAKFASVSGFYFFDI